MTVGKNQNKQNGGYTLIELIVVIAIITVLVGFIGYNISVTWSFRARECSKDITTDIQSLKVTTLAKSATVPGATGFPDTYMSLYYDGNNVMRKFHYKDGTEEIEQIGKRVKVFYGSGASMTEIGTAGAGEFKIIFNRSTGAIVTESGTVSSVKKIEVRSGKTYTIEVVPQTGKVKQKL